MRIPFLKDSIFAKQWLAILGLAVSVISVVAFIAYSQYQEELDQAESDTGNLALAIEQHTESTFQKIDLLLLHAQDVFQILDPEKLKPEEMSRRLFQMKKSLPEAEILGMTDVVGNDIANTAWVSKDESTFKFEKIFIGDRPFFIKHRNEPETPSVISDPIISRTTGNLIVNISRKVKSKDGKFKGIIFATLNLQGFSNFFAEMNHDTGSSITLFNTDFILLARYPFLKDSIGKAQPSAALKEVLAKIKSGKDEGTYVAVSAIDNVKRIFSYKKTPTLPFIVTVGKSHTELLSIWMQQQGVAALLIAIFLTIVVVGMSLYLKKLQEANRQKEVAEQALKMSTLGEMAAGIAHEINNPLAIISGKASLILAMLKSGQVDSEKLEAAGKKIHETAHRIDKIIRGLRSYSRNSSQDPMELASLTKILETAFELSSPRFTEKSVKLTMKPCSDYSILCREAQISQVLINLLNNAADAVGELDEKWVEVEVLKLDDRIEILVTDSGSGIQPEIAAKLMQPFFTTKESGKGTGLGLSISRKIMREHRGDLELDTSSKHTRFKIELPVAS